MEKADQRFKNSLALGVILLQIKSFPKTVKLSHNVQWNHGLLAGVAQAAVLHDLLRRKAVLDRTHYGHVARADHVDVRI
jgi:hypothetical protein